MKKDLAVVFGLILIVIALLIFGRGYTSLGVIGSRQPGQKPAAVGKENVSVKAKTLTVAARVSATSDKKRAGLAKLESLPLNEGMLFVFEKEGRHGIWMKDMKFAIDIIWIDKNKKIVDIEANVAPQPGKSDRELTIYKPATDALYVLEINAGLANLHGLEVSDLVEFEL